MKQRGGGMSYWIHEDGETTGPFRVVEALERAKPDTLVSYGQKWLKLKDHPDFSRVAATVPIAKLFDGSGDGSSQTTVGPSSENGKSSQGSGDQAVEYWVRLPKSGRVTGPYSREMVATKGTENLLVSHGPEWIRRADHPDFSESRPGPTPNDQLTNTSSESNAKPWEEVILRLLVIIGAAIVIGILFGSIWQGTKTRAKIREARAAAAQSVVSPGTSEQSHGIVPEEMRDTVPSTLEGKVEAAKRKAEAAQVKLKVAESGMRRLEATHNALYQQFPTFHVTGQVIDRYDTAALLWGMATSSNNDLGHLGTMYREGNIQVIDVYDISNPRFFGQRGMYFVQKTTIQNRYGSPEPLRVYSPHAPPAYMEAEAKMRGLLDQMRALKPKIESLENEIEGVENEIALLAEQIERRDWDAVKDDPILLLAYAKSERLNGRADRTEKALLRACQIDPDNIATHIELGSLYAARRQLKEAESEYRTILSIDPSNAEVRLLLGQSLFRHENDKFEAVAILKQCISEDPYGSEVAEIEAKISETASEWGRVGRHLRLEIDSNTAIVSDEQISRRHKLGYSRLSMSKQLEIEAEIAELKDKRHQLETGVMAAGFDLTRLETESADDLEYWQKRKLQWVDLARTAQWARDRHQRFSADTVASASESVRWREQMLSQIEAEARSAGVDFGDTMNRSW